MATVLFTVGVYAPMQTQCLVQPDEKASAPIVVKVVVVTMFEIGADTGDAPGELQYWVERDHLDKIYEVAGAGHTARMNDQGEMAVLTGLGPAHAAATIMAVGLDKRFDFSHAYWIVAGIAGGDPERVSLGSAAWARWVVDGDLSYELDAREIPEGWKTGMVPLRKSKPYEWPPDALEGQSFQLNSDLAVFAFNLTKDIKLGDTPEMADARKAYDGASAQKPPFVTMGDELSSARYWHGAKMEEWAQDWMTYFSGGNGVYTTTAMEDTGTLEALRRLSAVGRVDWERVMVLRTVSNFDRQPKGLSAAESLVKQQSRKSVAFLPALESAYVVGHTVVSEILKKWPDAVGYTH
jgi:purine nucleoside permease